MAQRPNKEKLLYFDFFDCIGAVGFCFSVERFLALWAVVVDRWFACSAHNKTFWVRIPLPPLANEGPRENYQAQRNFGNMRWIPLPRRYLNELPS